MRTTLTLDDEVVIGIKRIQKKRPGTSFKQIVNQVMKKGLAAEGEVVKAPFKIVTFDAIPKPGLNFDNVQALLSQVEGDSRKW
ncbi:MAG: hypothetical protein ACR2M8_03955 [Pyrinomonadaceae bacterium]|jgi:hypothetical protein|nr:hypothetical protein [Acidobacteriota bacterium]MDQ3489768.1 hypothetical protein [Acidobacteriota bacterium]